MEYNGEGAYDDKAGFLNGFKPEEAAAIKTVTQRSIVSHPEYTAGYIDAPGTDLPYNTDIDSVADGYEGAHYENITDKVFLLDVKQLHTVSKNLGSYYIGWNRNGTQWNYWLRTPVTDCNHDMRYVTPQGSILARRALCWLLRRPSGVLSGHGVLCRDLRQRHGDRPLCGRRAEQARRTAPLFLPPSGTPATETGTWTPRRIFRWR